MADQRCLTSAIASRSALTEGSSSSSLALAIEALLILRHTITRWLVHTGRMRHSWSTSTSEIPTYYQRWGYEKYQQTWQVITPSPLDYSLLIFSLLWHLWKKERVLLYGQQHDKLILTVKYSQWNLCFMVKLIRLKINWWSLTVLYSLTCCWLYFIVPNTTQNITNYIEYPWVHFYNCQTKSTSKRILGNLYLLRIRDPLKNRLWKAHNTINANPWSNNAR
jgi:hypothetical protein